MDLENKVMEKKKLIVAFDPGKSGGIAAMSLYGNVVAIHEMPLIGKEYDEREIKDILTRYMEEFDVHVLIELVNASPMFGMVASASLMHCRGLLQGISVGLDLPYTMVLPKTWQKECWEGIRKVEIKTKRQKKDGSYVYKVDPKPTSELAAKRLFPKIDLRGNVEVKYYSDTAQNRKLGRANKEVPSKKKKNHDGIIDALLIAEYGRRKLK